MARTTGRSSTGQGTGAPNDPVVQERSSGGAMGAEDVTLAEWVSNGWKLGLCCRACRRPVAALSGEDIMARFGDSLLATVREVCARMKCPACGGRGGWATAVADVSPELAVDAPGERLNTWVARDLNLRRLLAEQGRPLEIADFVWARMTAFGEGHPDWEPRRPAVPGYPLSAAGAAALARTQVPLG